MDLNIDNLLASKHNLKLNDVSDAIEIIGSGLPGVIFTTDDIGKSFFELKNGILGETFQKIANYQFPIAIVLPINHDFGDRVTELAREHCKHNCIRFCTTIEDAKLWIMQKLYDKK